MLAQIASIGIWVIIVTPRCEYTSDVLTIEYNRPETCKQDARNYQKRFPMYDFQCVQEKDS